MVTCLIGFMGILGFMGTITLSNRPWCSSLFTFHMGFLISLPQTEKNQSKCNSFPPPTGEVGGGFSYCPKKIFTIALASAIVILLSLFTSAAATLKFVMLDGSVDRK